AGRDIAARIAELDQPHDGWRGFRECRWIWGALWLSCVICSNVGKRGLIESLRDLSHQRVYSASCSVIIQLLVNCRTRLTGKIRIFRSSRHALLAMARDADLLCLGRAPFRFGVGQNLQ